MLKMTGKEQITIEDVLLDRKSVTEQIAITMAHTINNTIGYIFSDLNVIKEYFENIATKKGEDIKDDAKDCLKEMGAGAEKIRKMARSLSVFTTSGYRTTPADLGESIDCTLDLFYFNEVAPPEKEYSKGLSNLNIDYSEINHALFDIFRCIELYRKETGKEISSEKKMKIKTERKEGGTILITVTYGEHMPNILNVLGVNYARSEEGRKMGGIGFLVAQYLMRKNSGDLYIESSKYETVFELEFKEREIKE